MSEKPKPIIGISAASVNSVMLAGLIDQIIAAGGTPVFLGDPAGRNPAEDIAMIDALVLMGNDDDINPADYGQTAHKRTQSEDLNPKGQARSDYEYAILSLASNPKINMPTYGICGGMQRINVFLKGSLHQHVPDLVHHDEHDQRSWSVDMATPVEAIRFASKSVLNDITQRKSAMVPARTLDGTQIYENSAHHQAIDKVGDGLMPSAFSLDEYTDPQTGEKRQLIEGIETDPDGPLKDWPMVGVQFHPEARASHLGESIAQWITDQGAIYAARPGREHEYGKAEQVHLSNVLDGEALLTPLDKPTYTIESPRRLRSEDSIIGRLVAEQSL